jgi:hypothetical protein
VWERILAERARRERLEGRREHARRRSRDVLEAAAVREVTLIARAPSTTCRLVITDPAGSIRNPLPCWVPEAVFTSTSTTAAPLRSTISRGDGSDAAAGIAMAHSQREHVSGHFFPQNSQAWGDGSCGGV